MRPRDPGFAVPLGALSAMFLAAALVGVRGEVSQTVVALLLGVVVAAAGQLLGRAGGVAAALGASAMFDFLHTRPYLSLKIADGTDVLATAVLLVLGLMVGGLAARLGDVRDRIAGERAEVAAFARLLQVARRDPPTDVEDAVCSEVRSMLHLQDCWFTREPVHLPELGPRGALPGDVYRMREGGFELPLDGFAVPVDAHGERLGSLVCLPWPGVGVGADRCRSAVAVAAVLGLAIAASPRAA